MSTPTPRTDTEITFSALYTCTHHNDKERATCPVCLVASLTAERDQLRDELAGARQRETVAIASWDEERGRALREGARVVELKARAELAEAALADAQPKSDHYMASWLERAAARAEKAERELAAERARLDSGQILLTVSGERVWHCGVDLRAAIDAGIKEDAK